MNAPTTYSEWTVILEHFANGDDTTISAINDGRFVLDAGTAQRFYTKVEEAYKKRKQNWLDKFQRSFQMQNIRTNDDFGIALRNGKQNLLPLVKFVAANGLPDDLQKVLQKDLTDFVAEIKKSLQDNTSKTSNDKEKMLIQIQTFGLPEIQPTEKAPEIEQTTNITPASGRKILF